MRWEDERYVRAYTRDTVDWLALSFEAQGLFHLILRKMDRAGIIGLGRRGAKGVAAIIGHAARWETIQPVLQELLEDGCVVIRGDRLIMPNFIAAQEAATSDAQRQRDKRERDLAKELAKSEPKVTEERHAGASRPDVTPEGHAGLSRPGVTEERHAGDVTPNLPSLPNQEDKDMSAEADPSPPAEAVEPGKPPLVLLPPPPWKPSDQALQVFEHWRKIMSKGPRAVLDPKRRTAVEKQLKAGRTVAELCKAVDGCSRSAWNMGANDRGKRYDDLGLICRDAQHVEDFIAAADGTEGRPPPSAPGQGKTREYLQQLGQHRDESRQLREAGFKPPSPFGPAKRPKP